jgi:hypothetical protein
MDWHGVPESAQNRLTVSVWHDVVEETQATAGADLPTNETGNKPEEVITIWQPTDISHPPEIVPFTQRNIVSAIAALISALPLRQRMGVGVPVATSLVSYFRARNLSNALLSRIQAWGFENSQAL